MKLVDKLQTLEKEDARKVVFEELGKRAIDMLNEISKATLGSYVSKAGKSVSNMLNKAEKHIKKTDDLEDKILNIRNPDSERGERAVDAKRDEIADREDEVEYLQDKAKNRSSNMTKAIGKIQNKTRMFKEDIEQVDEAKKHLFEPGRTVWTSHTEVPLKGTIVSKDEEDKNQYIVNTKTGKHSVHKDSIHPSQETASMMLESEE